jgi:hypothetical protein
MPYAKWDEADENTGEYILFFRIDGIDFSFHAIPDRVEIALDRGDLTWSGVRPKPIAPIVLSWARKLLDAKRA